LYGLDCATFTQRVFAFETAAKRRLKPFLFGRNTSPMNTRAPLAPLTPHDAEPGGQVAVDLGAGKGIDQAIPSRLAREGMVVVASLASTDASYITGQVIYVDGGITAPLSPPGQPLWETLIRSKRTRNHSQGLRQ
jgi:hypothetical protein